MTPERLLVINALSACRAVYPFLVAVRTVLKDKDAEFRVLDAFTAISRAENVLNAALNMNDPNAMIRGGDE